MRVDKNGVITGSESNFMVITIRGDHDGWEVEMISQSGQKTDLIMSGILPNHSMF